MPYWTLNNVDDGFHDWQNVTKPQPQASAVKDFDYIRQNLVFTDYGGTRSLDHDDGSQMFVDSENVLVGSGVKNFLGHTKHFVANLILGAGVEGISCYQSDSVGGNHLFANNTCQYSESLRGLGGTHGAPYKTKCTNETGPGTAAFRAFMQKNSWAAQGNQYLSANGIFELNAAKPCVPYTMGLNETYWDTGLEEASSQGRLIRPQEATRLARKLLQVPER